MGFTCSSCASLGFFPVLQFPPKDMPIWSTGYSELAIGVNMSVIACLSRSVRTGPSQVGFMPLA